MAVNAVKGQNVTKYDSPGGDNIIPDGYVKSVEKVWLDNYTLTSNITLTNTSIALATLPVNKKITSIDIQIQTSASQTSGTLSVGFTTDSAIDTLLGIHTVSHNETMTTLRLPGYMTGLLAAATTPTHAKQGAFQKVTAGTQVTIALKLNNWTMSTGTVKSVVRYV